MMFWMAYRRYRNCWMFPAVRLQRHGRKGQLYTAYRCAPYRDSSMTTSLF